MKKFLAMAMVTLTMVATTGCGTAQLQEVISNVGYNSGYVADLGNDMLEVNNTVSIIESTTESNKVIVSANNNTTADANTDNSGLPYIEGVDFASEIENFVETPFNVVTMKVGDKVLHPSYIWASTSKCYTSNSSIVTVASNGAVTAHSSGVAYVVIKTPTALFSIAKFVVE